MYWLPSILSKQHLSLDLLSAHKITLWPHFVKAQLCTPLGEMLSEPAQLLCFYVQPAPFAPTLVWLPSATVAICLDGMFQAGEEQALAPHNGDMARSKVSSCRTYASNACAAPCSFGDMFVRHARNRDGA